MKTKYQKGDKVRYWGTKFTETTCKTCGHTEEDYKKVKKESVIKSINITDQYYSSAMFDTTEDVTVNEDGTLTYKPQMAEIKPTPKIAFYTLEDGSSATDDRIIKKL
jgi:hypothetical protein